MRCIKFHFLFQPRSELCIIVNYNFQGVRLAETEKKNNFDTKSFWKIVQDKSFSVKHVLLNWLLLFCHEQGYFWNFSKISQCGKKINNSYLVGWGFQARWWCSLKNGIQPRQFKKWSCPNDQMPLITFRSSYCSSVIKISTPIWLLMDKKKLAKLWTNLLKKTAHQYNSHSWKDKTMTGLFVTYNSKTCHWLSK